MSGTNPVVLVEGFDHLSTAQLPIKGWAFTIPIGGGAVSKHAGRIGGECLRLQGGTTLTIAAKSLPAGLTSFGLGVAVRVSSLVENTDAIRLQVGSSSAITLRIHSTSGSISVLAAGGTIASGGAIIVPNVWYYIEIHGTIHASTAEINVRVNGQPYAAETNVNTGSSAIDRIGLASAGASGTRLADFDDLYVINTNAALGDSRVETLDPTGDGNHEDWTPDTGSDSFARLDDGAAHDGDTSYIASSTVGHQTTLTYPALTTTDGTVHAVAVNLIARKDDAGARTIAPLVRHDGTTETGPTSAGLSTDYLVYQTIYDENPETEADWTVAEVDASEFGVEVIA